MRPASSGFWSISFEGGGGVTGTCSVLFSSAGVTGNICSFISLLIIIFSLISGRLLLRPDFAQQILLSLLVLEGDAEYSLLL
jgi:hypothetical protein